MVVKEVAASFVNDLDIALGGAAYISFAKKKGWVDSTGNSPHDWVRKVLLFYNVNRKKVIGAHVKVLHSKPILTQVKILSINRNVVQSDQNDNSTGNSVVIKKIPYSTSAKDMKNQRGWVEGTTVTKGWMLGPVERQSFDFPCASLNRKFHIDGNFPLSNATINKNNSIPVSGNIEISGWYDVPACPGTIVPFTTTVDEAKFEVPYEATMEVGNRQITQNGVWYGVAVNGLHSVVGPVINVAPSSSSPSSVSPIKLASSCPTEGASLVSSALQTPTPI